GRRARGHALDRHRTRRFRHARTPPDPDDGGAGILRRARGGGGRRVHRRAGLADLRPRHQPDLQRPDRARLDERRHAREAWFFSTGDAVTASPTVVNGTLYVGSWDGKFYAVDAVTGAERWHFTIDAQLAIHPQPGNRQPGDLTSDGGVITSSAYFLPAAGARPDLVIFGGGYTL